MMPMSVEVWISIQGIMMTSERIAAYGGVAFDIEVLKSAVELIRSGALPVHVDHNLAKPLRTRNPDAYIYTRPDGIHELHFSYEIHSDDAHWVESRQGVSVTVMVPLDRDGSYVAPINPKVEISADHAWFGDESLLDTEAALIAGGFRADEIKTDRAMQFSFAPDPQIFLTIALGLLTSVGGSAFWAGIVRLLRGRRTPGGGDPKQPTTINIKVTEGNRSLTAIVQTNDEAVAFRAIGGLESLTQFFQSRPEDSVKDHSPTPRKTEPQVVVWRDRSREWLPPT